MPATAHVLLVEDNLIDARATTRALKDWETPNQLQHVTDGDMAIAHLQDVSNTIPDLVLLDLNLPGSNGHDVLGVMQTDERLRPVPVIVLTTSASDMDIARAYDLGANAFITKPHGLDAWSQAMSQVEQFWFGVATLPPGRPA